MAATGVKVAVETITNFALVNVFDQDLETAEQYSKTAGQTGAMLAKALLPVQQKDISMR